MTYKEKHENIFVSLDSMTRFSLSAEIEKLDEDNFRIVISKFPKTLPQGMLTKNALWKIVRCVDARCAPFVMTECVEWYIDNREENFFWSKMEARPAYLKLEFEVKNLEVIKLQVISINNLEVNNNAA